MGRCRWHGSRSGRPASVNGIGHYWGYRNYASPDTSTNVFPWGIIIGGEELHNNHHAYGTSAKFSAKWYEFDIGWGYIRILQFMGLAKIKRSHPSSSWNPTSRWWTSAPCRA